MGSGPVCCCCQGNQARLLTFSGSGAVLSPSSFFSCVCLSRSVCPSSLFIGSAFGRAPSAAAGVFWSAGLSCCFVLFVLFPCASLSRATAAALR